MNARITLIACLFILPSARAGNVTYTRWDSDTHDTLVGPLRESFALHVRAASRWLIDATWVTPVTPRLLELFGEQYMDATYVSLHYTFMRDGKEETRVYHAMSGEASPWPIHGMTPVLDYAAYVKPRRNEVWATVVAGEVTAIVSAPVIDDMPRDIYTASAEYKAMRSVERDIDAKRVPAQGKAVFFVSRPSCSVCQSAINFFAQFYASDTQVNQIVDAGSPLSERFVRDRLAFLSTVRASMTPDAHTAHRTCPAAIPPGSSYEARK
jgi:hypothetical protein